MALQFLDDATFAGDTTFSGGVVKKGSGGYYLNTSAGAFRAAFWDNGTDTRIFADGDGSTAAIIIDSGNTTFAGDITVSGGDITLGGTGRITGVDTVSSGTDAANKTYVDTAIAGVPQGDITGVGAGSGLTGGGNGPGSVTLNVGAGTLIDITADAVNVDLSELTSATGDMISTDSFVITRANGTQFKTVPGLVPNNLFSNDAGYITSSSLPTVGNGSLTLSTSTGLDGGTQIFFANQSANSNFTISLDLDELASGGTLVGADSLIAVNGGVQNKQTISSIPLSIFNNNSGFLTSLSGAVLTTGNQGISGTKSFNSTLNVNDDLDMEGGNNILMEAAGMISIDGDFGSSGQVLTTRGSYMEWATPSSGGITGSGVSGRIPVFSGTTSVTSDSVFTFNTSTNVFSAAKIAYTPITLNRGIQYFGFGTTPGSTIKLFNLVGNSSQGTNVSSVQGDNYWVAPAAGRIKSITVRNVKDTPTSGNTRFKIYKNGSNTYTSSYIQPTGANSVGQSVQLNNINHTFSNLDRINIGYQGQTSTTNWKTCALTIVIQFTDYEY